MDSGSDQRPRKCSGHESKPGPLQTSPRTDNPRPTHPFLPCTTLNLLTRLARVIREGRFGLIFGQFVICVDSTTWRRDGARRVLESPRALAWRQGRRGIFGSERWLLRHRLQSLGVRQKGTVRQAKFGFKATLPRFSLSLQLGETERETEGERQRERDRERETERENAARAVYPPLPSPSTWP